MTSKSVELNAFSRRKNNNSDIGWILLVRSNTFMYFKCINKKNKKFYLYLVGTNFCNWIGHMASQTKTMEGKSYSRIEDKNYISCCGFS